MMKLRLQEKIVCSTLLVSMVVSVILSAGVLYEFGECN